jgi:hypothetical protein
MKYALLIYSSPDVRDIPEDRLKSVVGEYDAILDEPRVLDSMQLQGTESATSSPEGVEFVTHSSCCWADASIAAGTAAAEARAADERSTAFYTADQAG